MSGELADDPELQGTLARDALGGFEPLRFLEPPNTPLPSQLVGAIVRLIVQAEEAGLAVA